MNRHGTDWRAAVAMAALLGVAAAGHAGAAGTSSGAAEEKRLREQDEPFPFVIPRSLDLPSRPPEESRGGATAREPDRLGDQSTSGTSDEPVPGTLRPPRSSRDMPTPGTDRYQSSHGSSDVRVPR